MEKEYEQLKEVIATELKTAIKNQKIGISMDLWSDQHRNIHYMGSVAHYMLFNKETGVPVLVSRLLKLEEMETDAPKTADLLHNHFMGVLHEFDIQDEYKRLVFITDRGKNIVNACDGYLRNSCIDHFINNVVCDMVKEIEAIRVNIVKVYIQ